MNNFKEKLQPIIDQMKDTDIEFLDIKYFNERVYSKLNYLFRKNNILTEEQANKKYSNYDTLYKKYDSFLDLMDWLNDTGLSIIPEKTLFSAYLGVSVDFYNSMLKNATDSNIKMLFKNIDEYLTTNQFGSLINNDRKALEKIQKTETYGQEMRQVQGDNVTENKTVVLTYGDIMDKINNKRKTLINGD